MKSYTYNFSFSAMLITLRHTGACDPQDVGNVARGHDVRSDQNSAICHTGECEPQDVGNVARGHDVWSDQNSAICHTGECQYPVNKIFYWILMHLFITLLLPPTAFADDLGRLFTTPQQRQTLEKLRNQKPETEIKIPDITFEEPVVEEEKPVIGGITVNGLVYRKGGKSTAWINSANTFEGTFGNQYIQIDANNIKPDDVEIVIPINQTTVKLKAGETYNPEMDEVISPGYQDN